MLLPPTLVLTAIIRHFHIEVEFGIILGRRGSETSLEVPDAKSYDQHQNHDNQNGINSRIVVVHSI
jgi:hypothetical protein